MSHSTIKEIFDVLIDDCDGDWRSEVLMNARPEDIEKVKEALKMDLPDKEIAFNLGIMY